MPGEWYAWAGNIVVTREETREYLVKCVLEGK
jgi:hypothetical protein